MNLRCPRCRELFQLAESTLADVQCPACGQAVVLISGESSAAGEPPRTVGHFKLLERLGSGQFGVVWKAYDPKLQRNVAIKLPRSAGTRDNDSEREALKAARLDHLHIVPVYEVGREGDQVYIVSKLIEGGTLANTLRSGNVTPRESASLVRKLAGAVDHAHERGIIHCDLKPGNILVDELGEPYITDFGLARQELQEATVSLDGRLIGTPAYMSPEQARMESATRSSDVYALGVVLYELLTGQIPFQGNLAVLQYQILNVEPRAPRSLDPRVPRDLETICLKAMSKVPVKRYASAAGLADDLERYLEAKPIVARPVGPVGRAWRWAKRNPGVASLATGFAVLLFTVAIGASAMAVTQSRLRSQAEQATARERAANELAQRRLADSYVAASRTASQRGSWREALASADRALTIQGVDQAPARKARLEALIALGQRSDAIQEIVVLRPMLQGGPEHAWLDLREGDLKLYRRGSSTEGMNQIRTAAGAEGLSQPDREYALALMSTTTPEAITHSERALEADPFHHRANHLLLSLQTLSGNFTEADRRVAVTKALFSEDPSTAIGAALLRAHQSDPAAATSELDALAEKIDPSELEFAKFLVEGIGITARHFEQGSPRDDLELQKFTVELLQRLGPQALGAEPFGDAVPFAPILLDTLRNINQSIQRLDGKKSGDPQEIEKRRAALASHPCGLNRYALAWSLPGGREEEFEQLLFEASAEPSPFSIAEAARFDRINSLFYRVKNPATQTPELLERWSAAISEWVESSSYYPAHEAGVGVLAVLFNQPESGLYLLHRADAQGWLAELGGRDKLLARAYEAVGAYGRALEYCDTHLGHGGTFASPTFREDTVAKLKADCDRYVPKDPTTSPSSSNSASD